MLERIQAFADHNGRIVPDSIEVFDADVIVDQVTEQTSRGPLRRVELTDDQRARIAAAINAELGGTEKAANRVQAAKAKAKADRERAGNKDK